MSGVKRCSGCDGKGEVDMFIASFYAGLFVCPTCEGSGNAPAREGDKK